MVTCEVELFQNYVSLRRCPTEIISCQRTEIISFQCVETCLKLF